MKAASKKRVTGIGVLREIAIIPLGSGMEAQGILKARRAVESLTAGRVKYSEDGCESKGK
jgi:hypothetical protein